MNTSAPTTAPTAEERLEALEFLISQMALALEADSASMHARLDRLEAAISKAAPGALTAAQEEETKTPFTMDSLGHWMQMCVREMRAHQSASHRQILTIGELTMRIFGLGESLVPEQPPAIGQDAIAAMEKAKRQRPAN